MTLTVVDIDVAVLTSEPWGTGTGVAVELILQGPVDGGRRNGSTLELEEEEEEEKWKCIREGRRGGGGGEGMKCMLLSWVYALAT